MHRVTNTFIVEQPSSEGHGEASAFLRLADYAFASGRCVHPRRPPTHHRANKTHDVDDDNDDNDDEDDDEDEDEDDENDGNDNEQRGEKEYPETKKQISKEDASSSLVVPRIMLYARDRD